MFLQKKHGYSLKAEKQRENRKLSLKFFEGFKLLSMCAKFSSSSLSRKKYDGGNFTSTLCQLLQNQNESVRIWLIELTEPSDTLNCKPFFKHCIL